jgi:putative acetyltransferase
MLIRSESPGDAVRIHALNAACFPTRAEADLVDALRAAHRLSVSLVAFERDELVGHVGFSPVTVDDQELGFGLGPLAVLAEHRRKGIGAALVRAGLARCQASSAGLVVVLGDPDYYSRFGFEPARLRHLRDEFDGGDAFQMLELTPGTIPASGGLVRYADEFEALG